MPEMRRAKTQVLYRYTPKAVFRFNETYAWCAVTRIEMLNVQPLKTALAEALAQFLSAWDAVAPDNFPDPRVFPQKYEVGEPIQVHYVVAPLVFSCSRCRRVQWYSTLDKLMSNSLLRCRGCNSVGTLVQVPYTFIHECGATDTIYVPSHDPNHTIVLNNRGRFQDSNWFCQTCQKSLTLPGKVGLGLRGCGCAPRQLKRGTTLQDPAVHYTHTISLVDTEDEALDRALENPNLGESLLAGIARTRHYEPARFGDLLTPSMDAGTADERREAARRELIAKGVTDEKMIETMLSVMTDQFISPQIDLQRHLREDVCSLIGENSPLVARAKESRQLREYLFVRDHGRMQAQTLSSLMVRAREDGDAAARARYEADGALADRLGIAGLQVIEAFPLLLAAVGYSRVFQQPRSQETQQAPTRLNPFITDRPKVPIYVVQSATEALMFELDPWREIAWLAENKLVDVPEQGFTHEAEARLWLLQRTSAFLDRRNAHLVLTQWERERGEQVDVVGGAIFGLLHTLSHMLIAAAATHVGLDADSLAEYLFPVASAGVIYASGHQEFTLGGIISAFRLNLGYWLGGAYEASQRCIYDPLCRSRGGACHACSYLRFSCPEFNRTVSRSFLIGGPVEGLSPQMIGFWSPAVRDRALDLRGQVQTVGSRLR